MIQIVKKWYALGGAIGGLAFVYLPSVMEQGISLSMPDGLDLYFLAVSLIVFAPAGAVAGLILGWFVRRFRKQP
jgi:hypothetical protein